MVAIGLAMAMLFVTPSRAQERCEAMATQALGEGTLRDSTAAVQAQDSMRSNIFRAPVSFADSLAQMVTVIWGESLLRRRLPVYVHRSARGEETHWCIEKRVAEGATTVDEEPALLLVAGSRVARQVSVRDALLAHISRRLQEYRRIDLGAETYLVSAPLTRERGWRDSVTMLHRTYQLLGRAIGADTLMARAILVLDASPASALASLGQLVRGAPASLSTMTIAGRAVAALNRRADGSWSLHELGLLATADVLGEESWNSNLGRVLAGGISRGIGGTIGVPLVQFACGSSSTALQLLDPSQPDVSLRQLFSSEPGWNGTQDATGLAFLFLQSRGLSMPSLAAMMAQPLTRNALFDALLAPAPEPPVSATRDALYTWARRQCIQPYHSRPSPTR